MQGHVMISVGWQVTALASIGSWSWGPRQRLGETHSDVIKLGGLTNDVGPVLVVGELEKVLADALVNVHPRSWTTAFDELLDKIAVQRQGW